MTPRTRPPVPRSSFVAMLARWSSGRASSNVTLPYWMPADESAVSQPMRVMTLEVRAPCWVRPMPYALKFVRLVGGSFISVGSTWPSRRRTSVMVALHALRLSPEGCEPNWLSGHDTQSTPSVPAISCHSAGISPSRSASTRPIITALLSPARDTEQSGGSLVDSPCPNSTGQYAWEWTVPRMMASKVGLCSGPLMVWSS